MIEQNLLIDIRSCTTFLPLAEEQDSRCIDFSGECLMQTQVDYLLESYEGVREIPVGTPLRVSISLQKAAELKLNFAVAFQNLPVELHKQLHPRGILRRFAKGLSLLDFMSIFPDAATALQAAALGEHYGIWKISRPSFEDWLIQGVAGEKFVYRLKG